MSGRNKFVGVQRTHKLLRYIADGNDVRIEDVQERYGVKYPQARAYLKVLEGLYDLKTYREGRHKVWAWPYPAGVIPEIGKECEWRTSRRE